MKIVRSFPIDHLTKSCHSYSIASQQRSTRPLANPDLFKSTPPAPQSERKVSFQDTRRDSEGLYDSSPGPTKRSTSSGNKSKWQPLATVEPDPVQEHDPFSLGDSDDEDSKKKDAKTEDTERLKKATAEAMAGSIGPDQDQALQATEPSGGGGLKDKEAEDK